MTGQRAALFDAETGEQITGWTELVAGRATLQVPTDRMFVRIGTRPGLDEAAPPVFGETQARRPGDLVHVDTNPPVVLHRGGL